MQKCCQTLSETAPRLDRSKINDFADKATALSLDLLTTVPPMVSDQPKCKFDKKWLEKDSDSWHNSCSEYELAYYRPVLFKSSAGIVAREGLVGNRKHVHPPALPNQTECVQDQLRLNSDYPTKPLHMQAPLPTPSVSYSCDRSSQTQLVPEREHRKKNTGLVMSMVDTATIVVKQQHVHLQLIMSLDKELLRRSGESITIDYLPSVGIRYGIHRLNIILVP